MAQLLSNLWLHKDATFPAQHSANKTTDDITFDELTAVLQRSKNGEAGVHMERFKYADKEFTYRFLYFLNKICQGLNPPECWQRAIVIPIYKKGDKKKCDNYRGISILNSGHKLYTSIIKTREVKVLQGP
jgi:hypothetical protein